MVNGLTMSYSFEIPSSSRLYIYALLFSTSADFVTVLVEVKVKKNIIRPFFTKGKGNGNDHIDIHHFITRKQIFQVKSESHMNPHTSFIEAPYTSLSRLQFNKKDFNNSLQIHRGADSSRGSLLASPTFFDLRIFFGDPYLYNELHVLFFSSSDKRTWATRPEYRSPTRQRKRHQQLGPKTHL